MYTLSRVKKKKNYALRVEQPEASFFVEHQNSVRQLIESRGFENPTRVYSKHSRLKIETNVSVPAM